MNSKRPNSKDNTIEENVKRQRTSDLNTFPQINSLAEAEFELFLTQLESEGAESCTDQNNPITNTPAVEDVTLNESELTQSPVDVQGTTQVNETAKKQITYTDAQLIKKPGNHPIPYLSNQYPECFNIKDISDIQITKEDELFAQKIAKSYKTFISDDDFYDYFRQIFNDAFYRERQTFERQAQFFKAFMKNMNKELNSDMNDSQGERQAQMFFDILHGFPAYSQIKLFSYALHHHASFTILAMQKMVHIDRLKYNQKKISIHKRYYFHHYFLILLSNRLASIQGTLSNITCVKLDSLLHFGFTVLSHYDKEDILSAMHGLVYLNNLVIYDRVYKTSRLKREWKNFLINFIQRIEPTQVQDVYNVIIVNFLAMILQKSTSWRRLIDTLTELLFELRCTKQEMISLITEKVVQYKNVLVSQIGADNFDSLIQSMASLTDNLKIVGTHVNGLKQTQADNFINDHDYRSDDDDDNDEDNHIINFSHEASSANNTGKKVVDMPHSKNVSNAPKHTMGLSDDAVIAVEYVRLNDGEIAALVTENNKQKMYSNSELNKISISHPTPYLIHKYDETFNINDVIEITPTKQDYEFSEKLVLTCRQHSFDVCIQSLYNNNFYLNMNTYQRQVGFFKAFCYHVKNENNINSNLVDIMFTLLDRFPAFTQIKLFSYATMSNPVFIFLCMQVRSTVEQMKYAKNIDIRDKYYFHRFIIIFLTNINLDPKAIPLISTLPHQCLTNFLNAGLDVLSRTDLHDLVKATKGFVALYLYLLQKTPSTETLMVKWKKFLFNYIRVVSNSAFVNYVQNNTYDAIADVYFAQIYDYKSRLECLVHIELFINLLMELKCDPSVIINLLKFKIKENYAPLITAFGKSVIEEIQAKVNADNFIDQFRSKPRNLNQQVVVANTANPQTQSNNYFNVSHADSQLIKVYGRCSIPYLANHNTNAFNASDVANIKPVQPDYMYVKLLIDKLSEFENKDDFDICYNLLFDTNFYEQMKVYSRQVQFFKAYLTIAKPFDKTDNPKSVDLMFHILSNFPAYTQIKLFTFTFHNYPTLIFTAMKNRAIRELSEFNKSNIDTKTPFYFHRYLLVFFTVINKSPQLIESAAALSKPTIDMLLNMALDNLSKIDVNDIASVLSSIIMTYQHLLYNYDAIDQTVVVRSRWMKFLSDFINNVIKNDQHYLKIIYNTIADVCLFPLTVSPKKYLNYINLCILLLNRINCPDETLVSTIKERINVYLELMLATIGHENYQMLLDNLNGPGALNKLRALQFSSTSNTNSLWQRPAESVDANSGHENVADATDINQASNSIWK